MVMANVAIWLYGYMAMAIWQLLYGNCYMTIWLYGYMAIWLYNYMAISLYGYMARDLLTSIKLA
jgi:hypothetical protein